MSLNPSVTTLDPVGTAVAQPAGVRTAVAADDRRVSHAQTDLPRFAGLIAQLGLLLVVFAVFRVDEGGFLRMTALAFGGFAIHYWLPFAWKEYWWVALSSAGAMLLIGPAAAGLVLGTGVVIYLILASPFSYASHVAAVVALAGVLLYGRAVESWGLPWQFWPALGAVFMFRLMIYLYDLKFAKRRPGFKEFCVYFFPLPNFYFLLFPVIDYQTLRRTFYQRDIHAMAQEGITLMVRGAIQLCLYRLIYQLKPPFTPEGVTSFASLFGGMVAVYLLYLRVSGQFHIIAGLLHLFGYDLPETHRKYLLASSLTDFWRRINIYWKDFMVKLVYFPVYFRFRKRNETLAQVVATAAVFAVTWAAHSYQWFWLRGQILFTWPDTLFWAILGALVIVNVLWEQHARRVNGAAHKDGPLVRVLKTAGTFSFIVVLWSMWNSPTMTDWFDVVTWWRIG
jgi:alginate O-acetyltransferase complex protein AlgI